MRPRTALLITLVTLLASAQVAFAQYTETAGKNAPAAAPVAESFRDDAGVVRTRTVYKKPAADRWGNAQSNAHDLAVDGAFDGQTVAVLHFYTGEGFDFELPKAALKEKGFSVYRWIGTPPSAAELENGLAKASQLWLISGERRLLTPAHLAVIQKFFEAGHGVYIWGDNVPYYADANYVAEALFGATMDGNTQGEQIVGIQRGEGTAGLMANHLLTTGIERLYEGHTIATLHVPSTFRPLITGSANNLVTAYYDHDGKRALLDGGFTRLYIRWDTAGTARYVKNAASWLVNAERFGDAVVAKTVKRTPAVPAILVPAIRVDAPPAHAPAPAHARSWLPAGWIGLVLVGLIAGGFALMFLGPLLRSTDD